MSSGKKKGKEALESYLKEAGWPGARDWEFFGSLKIRDSMGIVSPIRDFLIIYLVPYLPCGLCGTLDKILGHYYSHCDLLLILSEERNVNAGLSSQKNFHS